MVGHWEDAALDLQYRHLIRSSRALALHHLQSPNSGTVLLKDVKQSYFPKNCLSKPFPLSACPISVESEKGTQDLDLKRQSLPKRRTLCGQKMAQKSRFSFKEHTGCSEDQPAVWLRKVAVAQATRLSTAKQRCGHRQLSSVV